MVGSLTALGGLIMQQLFDHIKILDHDKYTLPYCNCLLIEDDLNCLVDSSPHPKQRAYLEGKKIGLIVNSHAHSDHNSCNHLFTEARVLLHPAEHERAASGETYLTAYGYYRFPDEATRPFYLDAVQYQARPADDELNDGMKISTGALEFEVIALPGHSIGHCGFFFPRQGFIFTADINLNIKPIYAMLDSSVDDYISSLERLREIKADMLVGGHGPALYTENLDSRLREYQNEILSREEQILKMVRGGTSDIPQIAEQAICFSGRFPEPRSVYYMHECVMVLHHLERLERLGEVVCHEDRYYTARG